MFGVLNRDLFIKLSSNFQYYFILVDSYFDVGGIVSVSLNRGSYILGFFVFNQIVVATI